MQGAVLLIKITNYTQKKYIQITNLHLTTILKVLKFELRVTVANCASLTCRMGYSRKNPHPPDGWQEFLTPLCSWISCTSRPLPLPGFPRPETPPPARISLIILWPLIQHLVRWKYVESRPEYNDYIWRSILILICSCDMNRNLYE